MTTILLVDNTTGGQMEAITLLDTMTALTMERTMFSSDEVLDFCLDMRQALVRETITIADNDKPEPEPEPELVGV